MSNLIIYCQRPDLTARAEGEIPAIVALHPSRVLLLSAEPGPEAGDLTATVNVRARLSHTGRSVCSEEVTLHARGQAVDRLPFAVWGLLIGDLPSNLWWATPDPPPLASVRLFELTEFVQQIIYDSLGWLEPARGVAATAAWLGRMERRGAGGWRVVSDLNWRRLKYWRRIFSQALDPATAPGALETVSEVLVEHGPHAVVQAWELVSWLAAQLRWRVQAGRVQPGVEIVWQVQAAHGPLRLRIRRLDQGPSEIRRVRIACTLAGKPGALVFSTQDDHRLAVMPEGADVAPRTLTIQPLPLAELVAHQLSDRDADPVFRRSMDVAQVLAQSVLR
jgi:glucose-6-phosphate dehydrogenase assembly protein OpcA